LLLVGFHVVAQTAQAIRVFGRQSSTQSVGRSTESTQPSRKASSDHDAPNSSGQVSCYTTLDGRIRPSELESINTGRHRTSAAFFDGANRAAFVFVNIQWWSRLFRGLLTIGARFYYKY
jgi:hypothetical protein